MIHYFLRSPSIRKISSPLHESKVINIFLGHPWSGTMHHLSISLYFVLQSSLSHAIILPRTKRNRPMAWSLVVHCGNAGYLYMYILSLELTPAPVRIRFILGWVESFPGSAQSLSTEGRWKAALFHRRLLGRRYLRDVWYLRVWHHADVDDWAQDRFLICSFGAWVLSGYPLWLAFDHLGL